MRRLRVPGALRERIADDAGHRCGYCLSSEAIVGAPMEIDHILPVSLGGKTAEDNLWLACSLCNDCKADRIAFEDPESGLTVRLFDPRRQVWSDHFVWSSDGAQVIGTTPTGRATAQALRLNRPVLVAARKAWVAVGWHPPKD